MLTRYRRRWEALLDAAMTFGVVQAQGYSIAVPMGRSLIWFIVSDLLLATAVRYACVTGSPSYLTACSPVRGANRLRGTPDSVDDLVCTLISVACVLRVQSANANDWCAAFTRRFSRTRPPERGICCLWAFTTSTSTVRHAALVRLALPTALARGSIPGAHGAHSIHNTRPSPRRVRTTFCLVLTSGWGAHTYTLLPVEGGLRDRSQAQAAGTAHRARGQA